jgi:hypothetical protein
MNCAGSDRSGKIPIALPEARGVILRILAVLLILVLVLPLATCHREIYSRTVVNRDWRAVEVEPPDEKLLMQAPKQIFVRGIGWVDRHGGEEDAWKREVLVRGEGRVATAGDLVQIRVIDDDPDSGVPVRETKPVWYWLGNHLERTKSGPPYESMNAGAFSFGTEVLRASLVGISEGSSIRLETPKRDPQRPPFRVGEVVDAVIETAGQFHRRQRQRPVVPREMLLFSDSSYRVDVIKVCPAVLRRLDADHLSYGWWGDFNDPTRYKLVSRRTWLEIVRQCPGEPEARIKAGPVNPAGTAADPISPRELDYTTGEPPRFQRAMEEYRTKHAPVGVPRPKPGSPQK